MALKVLNSGLEIFDVVFELTKASVAPKAKQGTILFSRVAMVYCQTTRIFGLLANSADAILRLKHVVIFIKRHFVFYSQVNALNCTICFEPVSACPIVGFKSALFASRRNSKTALSFVLSKLCDCFDCMAASAGLLSATVNKQIMGTFTGNFLCESETSL
jgi:hypothetical protein